MTEKLIKRFLLERAYESGKTIDRFKEIQLGELLFEKLKNGEISINELEFESWLENLKRSKRRFGDYLKANGYLKNDTKVFELTDEEDVSSINGTCLRAEKLIIPAQIGEGCYQKPAKDDLNGHMVINGIYDNQLIYLARLLKNKNSSFTVGYYGRTDSEYTKRVIEYYRQLRGFLPLLVQEQPVEVIEEEVFNSDKIYVLSYNVKPATQMVSPIKTRYSER